MGTQAIQNTSSCYGCGSYLNPEVTETAWITVDRVVQVCPDCKKLIYQERIEKGEKECGICRP